jgi:cytoskeletal protein RodZ
MTFTRRAITAPDTLGERLRQLREEAGWTVEEVSQRITVAPKYIAAIESGRYQDLPGLVYARNFVKLYVELVKLEPLAAMQRFDHEFHVVRGAPRDQHRLVPRANTELPWWRRHVRFIGASILVLMIGAYIGWQLFNLWSPPRLTVSDPAKDISTRELMITVRGQTEPETIVTLNNDQLNVDSAGSFQSTVDLRPGLNTLEFSARSKHSGNRVVTRQVLVETPN